MPEESCAEPVTLDSYCFMYQAFFSWEKRSHRCDMPSQGWQKPYGPKVALLGLVPWVVGRGGLTSPIGYNPPIPQRANSAQCRMETKVLMWLARSSRRRRTTKVNHKRNQAAWVAGLHVVGPSQLGGSCQFCGCANGPIVCCNPDSCLLPKSGGRYHVSSSELLGRRMG